MVISEHVTGLGVVFNQRFGNFTSNLWMGLDIDRVPYLVLTLWM